MEPQLGCSRGLLIESGQGRSSGTGRIDVISNIDIIDIESKVPRLILVAGRQNLIDELCPGFLT